MEISDETGHKIVRLIRDETYHEIARLISDEISRKSKTHSIIVVRHIMK